MRLQEVPEEARIEFFYRDKDDIDGTAGGATVRVTGQLGPRGGPVRGTWGGVAVSWRLADKLGTPAGRVPGIIRGRVGDDPVKLEGSFLLGARYLLEEADISGDLGGHNLRAKVASADGGIGATSTVVAEGKLAEEPFSYSPLSDDLTRAIVRGSLGGRTVSLDATTDEPSAVRVVGEFSGPLPLLALIGNVLGALCRGGTGRLANNCYGAMEIRLGARQPDARPSAGSLHAEQACRRPGGNGIRYGLQRRRKV